MTDQVTDDGRITLIVPIFKPGALIDETLQSITAQTLEGFSVLLSVDGGDDETEARLAPWLADPRFTLTKHVQNLGWAGNINWCTTQVRTEFYLFWQQDDLADPRFLESLLTAMHAHPQAAITYCDVERFGSISAIETEPSVQGTPWTRMLDLLERPRWIPYLGLIRSRCLAAIGPLRLLPNNSPLEDLVWIAKAGREGDLIRVPETLYRKRVHAESLSTGWNAWDQEERALSAWINLGLGYLEALWPLCSSEDERWDALVMVMDRLTQHDEVRWMFARPKSFSERDLRPFARALADVWCAAPRPIETDGQPPSRTEVEHRLITSARIDRILRDRPQVVTWTRLPLLNGWRLVNAGFASAGFRQDRVGMVDIVGVITGGGDPAIPLARLPEGFRPRRKHVFAVATDTGFTRIQARPDGRLYLLDSVTPGYLSLDGVRYSTR
jgi:glycosyltransferase involved in cell wall biosynthesis